MRKLATNNAGKFYNASLDFGGLVADSRLLKVNLIEVDVGSAAS